jgi:hypothetical protein
MIGLQSNRAKKPTGRSGADGDRTRNLVNAIFTRRPASFAEKARKNYVFRDFTRVKTQLQGVVYNCGDLRGFSVMSKPDSGSLPGCTRGQDQIKVRAVLGHRSPQVTELYAELDLARAAEAMAKMG